MAREQIHFVTGKLAEPALRETLGKLSQQVGFGFTVDVLKINVAALMTIDWIARRLNVPPGTSRIILPGYCRGETDALVEASGVPVERGPKDLRDLAEHFGEQPSRAGYGAYDIEIIAEINHCPRMTLAQIVAEADRLAADGADVIDLGCDPGGAWSGAYDAAKALVDRGRRVSIDSYNPVEIAAAARGGAELALSVNATNRQHAADWGIEVVAVPDTPSDLDSLAATIELLERQGVRHRLDPVLEPIGFGFAASLDRYRQTRARWPRAEIMMGIGNLTELTDVDSAGVNVLLLAICQELGIRSVLTTQVIPWARRSVKECDIARQLVYHALRQNVLPKRLDDRLVQLRDVRRSEPAPAELESLAAQLKDANLRLFVADGQLHLVSAGMHLAGSDPFVLFDRLLAVRGGDFDASHAFYLGYELAKAMTALTIDKQYRQDEALDWGYLTRPETSHRDRRPQRGEGAE